MDIDPLPSADPLSQLCQILLTTGGYAFTATQIVALAISLVALLISGFISGSEIAYFSLTPGQIEELEDEGRSGARILNLLSAPDLLLATILIANNLVNVTIVVLMNFTLGPIFEGMSPLWSFLLQTVILTFLILLFGEILPKLYANGNNLQWAKMASGGLLFFRHMFYPLASMMVKSSGIVNRLVSKKQESLTTDDLSQALEITNVDNPQGKEMLEGILRFGDTTAGEIMTPRVDMTDIPVDAPFSEVLDTVIKTGYARIPVYEDTEDNIRGILYARDLLPYIGPDKEPPADWTTLLREPYYVPESRMIDDLLEDFRARCIHMAVVIDEFGGTQGIVTLEDVLEEIVGDIDDEYDTDEKYYRRNPDGSYIFEGRTPLTDFFRITSQNPEVYEPVTEDCETLAGMLLEIKGDFPKEKESLVYGYCRFLVLDIDHHRITSVRVNVSDTLQS